MQEQVTDSGARGAVEASGPVTANGMEASALGQPLSEAAASGDAFASGADLAAGTAQAAVEVPSYGWSGYFMGLALMFLMLALLWYGARLIKRNGALRFFGMTPALNVESRLSLGPRKHLLVVNYRGKRLLLGVTDHNINLLSEEPIDAQEAELDDDNADARSSGSLTSGSSVSDQPGKFREILNGLGKRN